MVVADNCCGVNGAGGGEYFNQGFDNLLDSNVGAGYVWDIRALWVGVTSYLLLLLLFTKL